MMEMKEFQQKLMELLVKAENQDKNLKNEEILEILPISFRVFMNI